MVLTIVCIVVDVLSINMWSTGSYGSCVVVFLGPLWMLVGVVCRLRVAVGCWRAGGRC